ncbi:hypothetical protein N3K66_001143 [Trichothecium roseum]|uniref:Uncharacterized protein n=1 Tax=Trichothecium roseum TaxID=47278 RepID=A0ACC0VDX7_9HYPO|nr:hypothetical protein N3K66_001143 [Trichothecium roseum]
MVSSSKRTSPLAMLLGIIFFLSAEVFAASAVLGVDLGTEYIKAALVKPGIPLDIVLTKDSRRKETAAVTFKPNKGGAKEGQFPERLYGSDALALSARFPGEVYPNLKTILGLPVGDELVQEYAARHPALKLEAHPTRGTAAFKTSTLTDQEEAWLVEELLAMELQSVQKSAEIAAGDDTTVKSIVLTVPPFYTTEEKRAVQSAAELAGLKVLSLISDGLAVGLNYATSRQFPNINEGAKPEYHMVFDMGAGSTKATVMKFQSRSVKDIGKFNKTVQEVQVLGSGWDRTLGGDALNNLIIDDMITQFVESKGAQKVSATLGGVKAHGRAMAKLTKESSRIRHILSANQNTQASFEGLYEDVDFKYKITRSEFEAMAEAHAERVGVAIKDALKMSGLDIADMDSVILHGGASRTPFVQKALEKAVGSADKLRSNVNSDEAAVFGAGFRAAELSPSFRVKEIKASEGANYPGGFKWVGKRGFMQHQRLWSPVSPLGGPEKEAAFPDEEADVSITFYQQIDGDDRDTKSVVTKNLTETIAALKEKYPTCADTGVQFKVGAKLSADNGEVQIVKAAVECEVEVKEGFVDGVKNLFGFGKKDQEPLKGENGDDIEGSEEVPKEQPADASADSPKESATESDNAKASGSTEELKPEAKKTEIVFIPVGYDIEDAGTPQLTKVEVTKAKDRLKAFANSDKARFQREEALNQLEGYTYKIRDMLEDESFIAASTEKERQELAEKSGFVSEWLYDDGSDAPKDELRAKLKELQDIALPIRTRVEESKKRPEALDKLKESIRTTEMFLSGMREKIVEYEAWQEKKANEPAEAEKPSSDFDGLEDEDTKEATSEDESAEEGPTPPLFKPEELDEVEAASNKVIEWLEAHEKEQNSLPLSVNPILLAKDIELQREKLEKLGRDLAMKGVKNFKPKDKKKLEEEIKKRVKNTKADDEDKPPVFEMPEGMTSEQLEEVLKNMKPEDWAKVKQEADKQRPHDEL